MPSTSSLRTGGLSSLRDLLERLSLVICPVALPPSAPPAATPPVSPSGATSKKSHDEEQQYRTDGSVHDCADHSRTEMDTQLRQQPASDKGAQNPDNEVTNDPKSGASHNLTCQPARDETDKQYHQQAFTRHIHGAIPHSWSDAALQADLLPSVQNRPVFGGFAFAAVYG
jgi:hypothetical protein